MRRGHWGHVGSPSSSAFALSRTSRSSGAIPGGLQVQAIDGIDDDAPDPERGSWDCSCPTHSPYGWQSCECTRRARGFQPTTRR